MSFAGHAIRADAAIRGAIAGVTVEHGLGERPDGEAMDAAIDEDADALAFWHAEGGADLVWALRAGVAAIQLEVGGPDWPSEIGIGVLFGGDGEIAELNGHWRGRPVPTNVLSWPGRQLHAGERPEPHWGELAFAYGTIRREAEARGWPFQTHFVHLGIHGALHCLGYDHEIEAEGDAMEAIETRVMARLGLPDPHD